MTAGPSCPAASSADRPDPAGAGAEANGSIRSDKSGRKRFDMVPVLSCAAVIAGRPERAGRGRGLACMVRQVIAGCQSDRGVVVAGGLTSAGGSVAVAFDGNGVLWRAVL